MDLLEAYIQIGGEYHPLVDLAITHYHFETIHPCQMSMGALDAS